MLNNTNVEPTAQRGEEGLSSVVLNPHSKNMDYNEDNINDEELMCNVYYV